SKLGRVFNVRERADLFWRNVSRHKWENHTFSIFQQFVRPGAVFLDIGAWIGPTVLFGACTAKHCYAVEPDPVAFEELTQNLALNPSLAGKVTVFQGCISDVSGKVSFGSQTKFGDSQSSLLFADRQGAVQVEALSFNDFLQRYQITACDFIKMDIEGGETIVLPTMKAYLAQSLPVLYVSLHQKWFKDKAAGVRVIADVLRVYPYVYTAGGNHLEQARLEEYLLNNETAELVCLKGPWPFFGCLRQRIIGS
ncbi:MAG: FkbM family methyltransferase, partial [Candidatus Omnitrophica bacterium]|nr:FkbM family methyltransferase [Candidatus Omnitrophota bacterium]